MTTQVEVWPLHGLRLRTRDLELRVVREADLPVLASVLPPDVDLDPSATRYPGLSEAASRRAILAQDYWRHLGTWSPDDWTLPLVVSCDGEVIGAQTLEGPNFREKRTVDSSSWLTVGARGRGFGTQMRSAILTLAFDPLGAWAAISSAVLSNVASLGVSRSLGYREVGREPLGRGDAVLALLRLERAQWLAGGHTDGVEIEGLEPCLPFFGLGPSVGDDRG